MPAPPPSAPLTVSELNRLARSTLERQFPLLWVAGEVSNLTRAPSGHVYFSLKDAGAQVRCTLFRNRAALVPWRLENGQQVEANALVTLYEPRGDFQLNIEGLRRSGLGKLYEAFLALRERLATEGLFADAAKRPLPRFPRCIGVVTSPRAAALQDILAALARRARHVPVIVYPTLVQGDGAAAQIAEAIGIASARAECDVLIVGRGGGSLEDLWAFNEEVVARAIRACPIPVVAGIGHETDTTIADYAADLRAATPTAAAELASAGWAAAADEVATLGAALVDGMDAALRRRMQAVDLLAHRLVHPAERLTRIRQQVTFLGQRLVSGMRAALQGRQAQLAQARLRATRARPAVDLLRARLDRLGASLQTLNPDATLARGYAIVRDAQGAIVRDTKTLTPGDSLNLRFAHGDSEAVVKKIFPD